MRVWFSNFATEPINSYADEEKNRVDINKRFRPTQYTLEEAEEKFPEWYERVIIRGDKRAKRWDIKRELYDWWLRQNKCIDNLSP